MLPVVIPQETTEPEEKTEEEKQERTPKKKRRKVKYVEMYCMDPCYY